MTRPRGPGARKGTEAGAGRKAPRPWGTIRLPPGAALVVAVDTLVAGVHFPLDTAPAAVGHKALAVNLSDLAAMGAGPLACSVALSLPAPARRSSGGAVAAGDRASRGTGPFFINHLSSAVAGRTSATHPDRLARRGRH